METSNIKFYYIQISVECCDFYEECFWNEGLVSYLDTETNEKTDLKNIADEMWNKFQTGRSRDWHINRNSQTTISLFENNTLGILYSDCKSLTDVDVIDGILDTMNLDLDSLNSADYDAFKDEIGYENNMAILNEADTDDDEEGTDDDKEDTDDDEEDTDDDEEDTDDDEDNK